MQVRQARHTHAVALEATQRRLDEVEAAHASLQREHAALTASYGGVRRSLLEDRAKLLAATEAEKGALVRIRVMCTHGDLALMG